MMPDRRRRLARRDEALALLVIVALVLMATGAYLLVGWGGVLLVLGGWLFWRVESEP